MNQLKWGVALSYVSMALGMAISLVFTPFMLRLLGQSEYGLYSLVASVVSYLGLLSFGFGAAYVRYYSRETGPDRESGIAKLNGLFLVIFTMIAVVCVMIGAVLIINIGPVLGDRLSATEISTARVLMGLMTFTVALSFPSGVFSSFVTATEHFAFQRLLQLGQTVLSPAVTLAVLLMGHKSIGMAAVAAGFAILVTAVNVWFCVTRLRFRFSLRGLDVSLAGEIAVFSSYIFINMVVDQINWNVDKYILGRIGGTVAVAVYGLAGQLNGYYMSLGSTISGVFIPRVNKMIVSGTDALQITHLFTRVGRVQFLVLALVGSGLVVFGQPFISVWAGADYSGAYPMLLLMMLPVTIPLIQNLGIEIQRAKNLHKFRSWVYLGMAILNVALSIPLALRYGGVGAALGTGVSLLIGNGMIMNVYYHRTIGLDMKYFWRQILELARGLLPVAGLGALLMAFVDLHDGWAFSASLIAFVLTYGVSMWLFGMNVSEKDLLLAPIRLAMERTGRSAR